MIKRLLKLLIATLFFLEEKSRTAIYRLIGLELKPTLVVLTYHSVTDPHKHRFARQMKSLMRVGNPVPLENINNLADGHNIAVTFDDAYQCILRNAVPLLRENDIPFSIFVPTGCFGRRPSWIADKNHQYAYETVMTEEDIRGLPAGLATVGSHTVSHIHLANVDESVVRKEIFESKRTLEKILNRAIWLFSAPFATLDKKFEYLFRQAGYKQIFFNIPTFPATQVRSYILGRISAEPSDWRLEYYLKLVGAYQWLPLAVHIKELLFGPKQLPIRQPFPETQPYPTSGSLAFEATEMDEAA